jgi:hypothetical protein
MYNRQTAMEWWNNLSFEDKFYQVIPWLNQNITDRHPDSLTGREIELLYNIKTQS